MAHTYINFYLPRRVDFSMSTFSPHIELNSSLCACAYNRFFGSLILNYTTRSQSTQANIKNLKTIYQAQRQKKRTHVYIINVLDWQCF